MAVCDGLPPLSGLLVSLDVKVDEEEEIAGEQTASKQCGALGASA
jgi:hypothetical protein